MWADHKLKVSPSRYLSQELIHLDDRVTRLVADKVFACETFIQDMQTAGMHATSQHKGGLHAREAKQTASNCMEEEEKEKTQRRKG